MTQDEKDWTMQVHTAAMEIVGICGLLSVRTTSGSKEQERADRAAKKALALAQAALDRINATHMTADQDAIHESGYDLNALAAAAPSPVKE